VGVARYPSPKSGGTSTPGIPVNYACGWRSVFGCADSGPNVYSPLIHRILPVAWSKPATDLDIVINACLVCEQPDSIEAPGLPRYSITSSGMDYMLVSSYPNLSSRIRLLTFAVSHRNLRDLSPVSLHYPS